MALRRVFILMLLCIMTGLNLFSQRYNFTAYSTDQGLLQSQVFGLVQTDDGQLWMATMAGISRFDGKIFNNYSTTEGLASAKVIHFIADNQQRIWAVTNSHLNLISGNKIYTYPLPQPVAGNRVRLACTYDNKIWCLVNGILYSFTGNTFIKEIVSGIKEQAFFALIKGEKKSAWLMAPKRTLYQYKAGSWQRFTRLVMPDSTSRVMNVYIDSTEKTWIQTLNGLMVQRHPDGDIEPWFALPDKHEYLNCVTKDNQGNLWVGGNMGAYKIKPDKSFTRFNYANGYSNWRTNDIMSDREGNIWFGTDGDGLLKFSGGVFTAFDITVNTSINKLQVVTNDHKGNLVFGYNGKDFCIYDGQVKKYPFKNTPLKDYDIISAFSDSHDVTWIGTLAGGLWKYEKGIVQPVNIPKINVYAICENEEALILRTDDGLWTYKNGILKKNPVFKEYVIDMIVAGKDSLLIAKSNGLELLRDSSRLPYSFPAECRRSAIAAFEKINNKIFIATIGEGIIVWDKTTGLFDHITTANGLSTNIIYSLIFDNKDQLWVGTGKGVSRLVSTNNFQSVTVRNYDKEQGFNGSECNSNQVAVMPDHTVWFGTTKGLYSYHPEEDRMNAPQATLTLQSVKLFSKPLLPPDNNDSANYSALTPLPQNLELASGNNHITFEFKAISYVNSNIRYSYYLQGLENNFSSPDLTNFVVYPALPPDKYIFKVKAVDESGKQLGDLVTYPFTIIPPFYQAWWFKLAAVLAVIGIAILVYMIRKNRIKAKLQLVEMLRAEEQSKIRKKTAQDFHDEMGNKLARITVLSDILKSKLPLHDDTQGLAKKIQENVSLLYQGTKDIIWSLNPENDNLHSLLKYVSNIGVDLFIDTEIEFDPIPVTEVYQNYYLPMDHARNMIMICKEVFTNIAKHAQCTKIIAEAVMPDKNTVKLTISDNGKSFNPEINYNGNGLVNIKQRVNYLGAAMQLHSEAGVGTTLAIIFTVSAMRPKTTNQ